MNSRPPLFLALLTLIFSLTAALQSMAQQRIPKVGLVLSGGGARAASHIGILKVFEKEQIPIDCIAATSFGSLVGGLYSLGYSAAEIENIVSKQDWDTIFSDAPQRRLTRLMERRNARYQGQISFKGWNPELPTGLWEGQRLTETLDMLTTGLLLQAQYDFNKLPIPFRAIATNLIDGRAFVFQKGSMTEALRASMAIPLLFTPLEKDGMLLADGGLVNNLPTEVARAMGADIVIAVDATTPLLEKDKIKTFIDVMDQSISLQMERNVELSRKLASVILQPELEKFTNSDYDKIRAIIKEGEQEAQQHLPELQSLVAGIPRRPSVEPSAKITPIIDSISFRGLKKIQPSQLESNIRVRAGEKAEPKAIGADVSRLYATRLFDSVTYALEPAGKDHYLLAFIVKESPTRTLGASLRYDSSYSFVALAEFTARQLFNSPSTATISSQFGGLEDHFASLRLIPSFAQFLFLEPKVEVRRLERLDIRNKELIDKFTDKREGGQLTVGASIFRQLEISGGYRSERVEISGGSEPNRLSGSAVLAGLTFHLHRDTLDSPEFPRSGMILHAQVDKRDRYFGSDFNYSKSQLDYKRFLSVSQNSTFQINASIGYSRGSVPFYDLFFIGGNSLSERASRPFFGLDSDEFLVRQMGIFGASYRRQIFSHPLSFLKGGFLTGTYNGVLSSTRETSPYNFDLHNGVGLGLALDTMIGPFRTAGGWSEAGRFHFYVSFGPTF